MKFVARTTFQVICFSAATAMATETAMDSFVRKIREAEDEETEFIGDINLDIADERSLDLLFADRIRGGGKKRDKDKKLAKQKVKKSKHILRMLKFAEPDRRSRDWLGYGCYCFADVKSDILTPGIGKAIDSTDRACRSLTECLKCSEYDYGLSKKCHPHVGYKYESVEDLNLGLRSINCLDSLDSCQRSMCECDRRFLQSIQEADYDKAHSPTGGFEKDASCPKRAQREMNGNTGDENGSKSQAIGRMNPNDDIDAPQQCCGPLGERHLISVTPTRGCCGQQTFNPFLFDCCADGNVEPIGGC